MQRRKACFNLGDLVNIEFWKERFEKRNKAIRKDIDLFIIITALGIPLVCWCVAQVIKGI